MIIEAPELAKLAFLVDDGDMFFAQARNSATLIHDTFLVTVSVPGEKGPTGETGREAEAKAAGMEHGKKQSKPADVALRFTSRKSLESFVLEACELLGRARNDVPTGDSLEGSPPEVAP